MMNIAAQSALARIDTLTRCLGAVSDLMIPERDLHIVNRDSLACLLDFFAREYQAAQQELQPE